jgi:hypothetical protein
MAVFSDAFAHLRQEIDEGYQKREKLMADIREGVRELGRQNGARLAEQTQARKTQFAAMLQDLRGTIRDQAQETRGQLAAMAADLRAGGKLLAGRRAAVAGNANGTRRPARSR